MNLVFNAVEDGKSITMTIDHVVPRSSHGGNAFENYQTLCDLCNNIKGSDDLTLEEINHLRQFNRKLHAAGLPRLSRSRFFSQEKYKILHGLNESVANLEIKKNLTLTLFGNEFLVAYNALSESQFLGSSPYMSLPAGTVVEKLGASNETFYLCRLETFVFTAFPKHLREV